MNESRFNVLVYLDESQSAFFAVVYTAILMMNMPNMHLTVLQVKESYSGSINTENNGLNSWPISPTSDRMKDVLDIFLNRAVDVRQQVIYSNPNIPDTVDALLEYARKWSIELIIMGAGELRTLKGLIFGNLAHTVQNKSSIPVLLVKNLTQDFIDSYRSKPILKLIR